MTQLIEWTETSSGPRGRTWALEVNGEAITTAGQTREPLRRRRPVGFDYWLLAGGGHRVWFPSEDALRGFVATALGAGTLEVGDRLEAIFVGMHWAHDRAYPFDGDGGRCRLLPEDFAADVRDARERLLARDHDTAQSLDAKAAIVLLTAQAAWCELRAISLDARPFPILQ